MMSVVVILYEIWPFVHFCDLWPSPVTFSFCQGHMHSITNRCTLYCCMLVPSMKLVGLIEFEIWTIVWNLNGVLTIKILSCSNANLPRTHLSSIPTFILIILRAEIHSKKVNRELWWNNEYCITVVLTFNYKESPILIEHEPVQ